MIRVGDLWQNNYSGEKYKVVEVEKDFDQSILNVKIQNINNAGTIFDVGVLELRNGYTKIDSYSKAKLRG